MNGWQRLAALLWLVPVLATVAGEDPAEAATAAERGRAIAEAADRRDQGFGDSVVELKMTLMSEDGRVRTRRLTWKTLEVDEPGAGDRSLTLFHEPRDIAGTAFQSHTYTDRPDEQWIYLPALKRVKRIPSANKSSAFVGSEFSYEDLLSDEPAKFDFEWLRDEPCGDWRCHVVARRPRYEESGYSRQVVWIDTEKLRTVRIDYYDLRGELEKTLELDEYRAYENDIWRARVMRMTNHRTGKRTRLEFGEFEFGTGLGKRDFDPGVLPRLR